MRSRVSPQRDRSAHAAWRLWTTFCASIGVSPNLSDTPSDKIPILQLFAQRYRLGSLSPCGRPVRSRTVEDAVRGVGQAFAGVGALDPRLNSFGAVDVRLSALFTAWKKADTPPTRVKPLPLQIVHGAFHVARLSPSPLAHAAADCMVVAFYFLLRPDEYAGTPKHAADDLFRLQDLGLWIGNRRLDVLTCPLPDLLAATFATLTFTSQKNGVRGETIGHGRSGHPTLCPVLRLAARAHHLRLNGATATTPLNAARSSATVCWQFVQPACITAFLRTSAVALSPELGFSASDVSARSTRSGGAMALLCAGIDGDRIRLIGRWRSDEMYRYLHVQAQPVMNGVAAAMFRGGTFNPWCSSHPSCAAHPGRRPTLVNSFGPMGAKAAYSRPPTVGGERDSVNCHDHQHYLLYSSEYYLLGDRLLSTTLLATGGGRMEA